MPTCVDFPTHLQEPWAIDTFKNWNTSWDWQKLSSFLLYPQRLNRCVPPAGLGCACQNNNNFELQVVNLLWSTGKSNHDQLILQLKSKLWRHTVLHLTRTVPLHYIVIQQATVNPRAEVFLPHWVQYNWVACWPECNLRAGVAGLMVRSGATVVGK